MSQHPKPANLTVTVTAAAGAAATLTLPALATGRYHHITNIQIVKFAAALLTAAAVPVLVTTTNINGSPIYSFTAAASAQGTSEVQHFQFGQPLRAAVSATATTIVCPATTDTIWRVNVSYFDGAD
jgi:hypothetical protein